MADPEPLAEIEFLARSPNRIAVLSALAEKPHTRQELATALDVSQPTLGRILGDLSDRSWVEQHGDRYRATATGELVATGITDLRDRLATETTLRSVVEWLPTDAIDVDLTHFADATITPPTQTRPNAPIQRMLDLLGETDRALLLSHAFNEQKLRLIHDRTADGRLTARGVFGADAIAALTDTPDLCELLADILTRESAEIRVTDREIPAAVEITDTRTHLLLRNEEGIVRASLDTADATVREWGETLHAEYWEQATPLSPDDLPE